MPTSLTGSTVASTYDQLLHINDGPTATLKSVYSGTGVETALKVSTAAAGVGNLEFSGNAISTTDTNGNLSLTPNGTGAVAIAKVAITGGSITGITDLAIADGGTGASTASGARTSLGLGTIATQNANNVAITGGAISGVSFSGSFTGVAAIDCGTYTTDDTDAGLTITSNSITADGDDTNIDIDVTPKGTGSVVMTKVDIGGGEIDGTVIGANTPAAVTATDVLATGSVGYTTGAGGTVTQTTSRTTGVTLDAICGQITMVAGTLSGHEADSFTLTNSEIAATDVVVANIQSGLQAGTRKYYCVNVVEVGAGSCRISVGNIDNGTIPATGTDTPVISFAVIKAVTA